MTDPNKLALGEMRKRLQVERREVRELIKARPAGINSDDLESLQMSLEEALEAIFDMLS